MPKTTTPAETVLVSGRQEIVARVKEKLAIETTTQADRTVKAVFEAIVEELAANIGTDGFKLKIPGFGQYKVSHTEAKPRRIPATGEMKMTPGKRKVKFNTGADLRALEPMA